MLPLLLASLAYSFVPEMVKLPERIIKPGSAGTVPPVKPKPGDDVTGTGPFVLVEWFLVAEVAPGSVIVPPATTVVAFASGGANLAK